MVPGRERRREQRWACLPTSKPTHPRSPWGVEAAARDTNAPRGRLDGWVGLRRDPVSIMGEHRLPAARLQPAGGTQRRTLGAAS